MAKIYGTSGARSDLIARIGDPAIQNLNDIKDFKKNLKNKKEEILEEKRRELHKEIKEKEEELEELSLSLEDFSEGRKKSFLGRIFTKIKIKHLSDILQNIKENFDIELERRNRIELNRLEEINLRIINNKNLIYGASGELKVIKRLKDLPDTFSVINDYRKVFYKPIYNRKEKDRIHSIQVDHIVVGPTGLFVIETKNWSKKNNKNPNLFSPVKQVERAGFALFVYLNDSARSPIEPFTSFKKGWGFRRISPKKIVVTMNEPPYSEFQYVDVLSLDKLNEYILNRGNDFSVDEINELVNFFLS